MMILIGKHRVLEVLQTLARITCPFLGPKTKKSRDASSDDGADAVSNPDMLKGMGEIGGGAGAGGNGDEVGKSMGDLDV